MSKSRLIYTAGIIIVVITLGLLVFADFYIAPAKNQGMEEAGELTAHYKEKLTEHLQLDFSLHDRGVFFIGDSITEFFDVNLVTANAVNLGISMDTTIGVIRRIPKYSSLQNASAVVLLVGVNDINRYQRTPEQIALHYKTILSLLPSDVVVFFNDVLPVDERVSFSGYNKIIRRVNAHIIRIAETNSNVHYISMYSLFSDKTKNLNPKYHVGDGVHLNTEGYAIFKNIITKNLIEKGIKFLRLKIDVI